MVLQYHVPARLFNISLVGNKLTAMITQCPGTCSPHIRLKTIPYTRRNPTKQRLDNY